MKVDPADHRVDQFYVFIFGFGFINEALHFAEMCVFSLSLLVGIRARSTYHRIKSTKKCPNQDRQRRWTESEIPEAKHSFIVDPDLNPFLLF